MKILIVDDSIDNQLLVESILKREGYQNVLSAKSAHEALDILKMGLQKHVEQVDLILMDIIMPEVDGIEACRRIKSNKKYRDIPIIMVTAKAEENDLKAAFDAGAIDYITKPFKKVELMVRVKSALRLKYEMDWRKIHEQELLKMKRKLQEANKRLKNLSSLDGLTGIANRRRFDELLKYEWTNAIRSKERLSLIMIDIDFFKAFNDTYGHQTGDECLRKVASALNSSLNRAGDIVARYGGEEFVVIVKGMNMKETKALAEVLRLKIKQLKIIHKSSSIHKYVTVSLGVSTIIPNINSSPEILIKAADDALYKAKQSGRNRAENVDLYIQEKIC